MNRLSVPLAAAVVATMMCASLPAHAAMPLTGAPAVAAESGIVLIAKKKKLTRRQEVDQSVQSGTVPARYRSSVPKQYQQYIPWAKK